MDSYAEAVNRATDQIQGLRSNAGGQADEYQNAFLGSVNDAITKYETKGGGDTFRRYGRGWHCRGGIQGV